MSTNILEKKFVERCTNLDSPEEYQTFLADVKKVAKGYDPVYVNQEFLSSSKTCFDKDKALIYLAVQDTDVAVSNTTLNDILLPDKNFDSDLAAASLYLVTQRADDDAYFRELLIAPDSFTPPKASEDGRYYMIKYMGLSANTRFVELLLELLTKHYHFCATFITVEALQILGYQPDEDEIPYTRSITVIKTDSGILIRDDDKYTGSSTCPSCSFFPCRINDYYSGGIESCKLWNEIDPDTAGEITDRRDWGKHLVSEKLENQLDPKKIWKQARQLMNKKLYNQAIPYLCLSIVLEEEFTTKSNLAILPLAWIYLSHCFSKY